MNRRGSRGSFRPTRLRRHGLLTQHADSTDETTKETEMRVLGELGTLTAVLSATLVIGCGDTTTDDSPVGGQSKTDTRSLVETIQAANAGLDENLGIIDRLVVDGGKQMVEFYRPNEHEILVSAAGRPSGAPVLTREQLETMRPAEIYAMLAPGRAVPAIIAAAPAPSGSAQADSSLKGAGGEADTETLTAPVARDAALSRRDGNDDGLVKVQSALTSGYCGTQWFQDFSGNGCGPTGGGGFSWCLTDWSGGASYVRTNVWASYYNVCPEIGSATLYVHGSAGQASFFVPQNTYRAFSRIHPGYGCGFLFLGWCHDKFTEQGDVTNASQTTFNYQGWYLWNN
jgi:hypothetical protein